jgi:N-acyl-phosphatidylethanolamine-hydrolysing phospholipase D
MLCSQRFYCQHSFDNSTIQALMQQPTMPHFFAPLGNAPHLESLKIPKDHVHALDWWESRQVDLKLPSSNGDIPTSFKITCTPCQHFAGRGLGDRFNTLWGSWAIENKDSGDSSKVWFAGDTGYRRVIKGENEDEVPVCPAFKEIGEKFGGFDLAMIPIG